MKASLQPIYPTMEAKPFKVVAMNFTTKLPPSCGYNSILTITDHSCTKVVCFIPCNETIMAEETTQLFLCFNTMASHAKSSAIKTPDSPPSSSRNCVKSWEFSKTYLPCITLERMDNLNATTSGLKHTYDSLSAISRTIGPLISQ